MTLSALRPHSLEMILAAVSGPATEGVATFWWGVLLGVVVAGGVAIFFSLRLRAAAEEKKCELQLSAQRDRALYGSLPNAAWVIDAADRRFLDVNAAAEQLHGWTKAEFLSMSLGDLRAPEDDSELPVADGSSVPTISIYRTKNGRSFEGETARCAIDFAGKKAMLCVVRDVTPARRAAEALRVSEERHRKLFETSPFGMVEYDYRPTIAWLDSLRATGVTDLNAWFDTHPAELKAATLNVTVTGMNHAMLDLVGGKDAGEVMASLPKIFTAEVLTLRRAAFLSVWSGRNGSEGEITVHALDGTQRRVYHHWWVPTVDGAPDYAHTQLALVDLTKINVAGAGLASQRDRLVATLDGMAESVITTDAAGVIQYMNHSAGELTGWNPAEATGRAITEVCMLRHERTGALISLPVNAALAASRPVDVPSQSGLVRRGGESRLIDGRCAPIYDGAKRPAGTVLVLRDMTDRLRMETELIRASRLESVGQLAGGIAHDFNNALATIVGNLALALMEQEVAKVAGTWLREAERVALRARDLTQQLLTFAKGGDPVRTPVLLPEVVREAAELALNGSPVRCEFDIAPDVRPADADKAQIAQVVQNLVTNAVQAMPAGGALHIKLRNDLISEKSLVPLAPGDYLRLTISDTGPGISAEYLSRIFEPYFSTKQQGSGLGLATVYSVIRKHRGHVTVESVVGKGTSFHVWLPSARPVQDKSQETRSPFEPLQGRILFMDDEEHIRKMTEALLTRLGMQVESVRDGDEAVQRYRIARDTENPFDVVMMDLTVPGGKGGCVAMQEILEIDPTARGIVSSGYSSDPVMANFRAHGFRGMLAKPYRVSDLSRTLREVLAEK